MIRLWLCIFGKNTTETVPSQLGCQIKQRKMQDTGYFRISEKQQIALWYIFHAMLYPQYFRGYLMSLCLVSDVNLEVTVVARISPLKVNIFLFIINTHHGNDRDHANILFYLKFLSTYFSIHWCMPEKIINVMF